jgi:alpha-tubulin suppressor-like RCC1 family protein
VTNQLPKRSVTAVTLILLAGISCGEKDATGPGADGELPLPLLTEPSLTASVHSTCILRTDGRAVCWGLDAVGRVQRPSVVLPQDSTIRFADLKAGAVSCGLSTDASLHCLGFNSSGAVGDGTTRPRTEFVRVLGGLRFRSAAAGATSTCAIAWDRTAWCWGRNDLGTLGNGRLSDAPRLVPQPVHGALRFRELISLGLACGVTMDGRAVCWGQQGSVSVFAVPILPGRCSDRYFSNFADGGCLKPTSVAVPIPVSELAASGGTVCGLDASGRVLCWGDGTGLGTLGDGVSQPFPPHFAVEARPARVGPMQQIAGGGEHFCTLDAGGQAWCWGNNFGGQLGRDVPGRAAPDSTLANPALPAPVQTSLRFKQVAVGLGHTCGLTLADDVWCWGSNSAGGLGQPPEVTRSLAPVRVTLPQ